jgi:hypothetical protein
LHAVVDVGWLQVVGRLVCWAWGCGVGHKPVGTSGCIHCYFALESVVCDGGGTECIAVHMELVISLVDVF